MSRKPFHYKPFLVLCLLWQALGGYAQNSSLAFAEFKKVNDNYRNTKSYSLEIQYSVYANYTTPKAESSVRSVYAKQDDRVLNKSDQSVIYQTPEHLLVVACNDKKIYLANPVKDVIKTTSLADIEKALSKGSEFSLEVQSGQKIFTATFTVPSSEYEQIRIWVDKKTNFISKMVFYLRSEMKVRSDDPSCKAEKPRMEVLIKNTGAISADMRRLMEDSYYFSKKGKTFEPSDNYKGYKVINNMIKG